MKKYPALWPLYFFTMLQLTNKLEKLTPIKSLDCEEIKFIFVLN